MRGWGDPERYSSHRKASPATLLVINYAELTCHTLGSPHTHTHTHCALSLSLFLLPNGSLNQMEAEINGYTSRIWSLALRWESGTWVLMLSLPLCCWDCIHAYLRVCKFNPMKLKWFETELQHSFQNIPANPAVIKQPLFSVKCGILMTAARIKVPPPPKWSTHRAHSGPVASNVLQHYKIAGENSVL